MMNPSTADLSGASFTHIIVGAGSAGCLLANRLSLRPENKILIVEAGDWDHDFWVKLPVGYFKSIHNPKASRHFATTPGEGTAGRSIDWPRGRVVGGSSSINGLIFIRGQRENFDSWAALGNQGWSYDDVLPYFRKFENFAGPMSQFHGNYGELQVSQLRNNHAHCGAWLKAAQEYGLPVNDDFNGGTSLGVGSYHLSIGKRWRSSSATAFLRPAMARSNVTVATGVLVEKVLIKDGAAIGIRLRQGGQSASQTAGQSASQPIDVLASAETILSAGAIQSPQLLQLSGIGPGGLLQELGIDVAVDRPAVGGNLQDHYQMRSIVQLRHRKSLNDDVRNPLKLVQMGLQWALQGRGALTVGAGQVGGAARTQHAPTSAPDIQFNVMPLSVDKPGDPLHRYSGFTAAVWQCHPESRGRIDITSADPHADPKIIPNYLEDDLDQKTIVAGIKMLRDIYKQDSFRNLWDEEVTPGADCTSDDDLLNAARSGGGTVYHCVGTCRMGSDKDAVVDPTLRVRGVDRLRVVDASIMPLITSANTNAPTYMIAEKGADMIMSET